MVVRRNGPEAVVQAPSGREYRRSVTHLKRISPAADSHANMTEEVVTSQEENETVPKERPETTDFGGNWFTDEEEQENAVPVEMPNTQTETQVMESAAAELLSDSRPLETGDSTMFENFQPRTLTLNADR